MKLFSTICRVVVALVALAPLHSMESAATAQGNNGPQKAKDGDENGEVFKVSRVEWYPFGSSPLDGNPEPLGGGKRIFPDRDRPGAALRDKVIVWVQVQPKPVDIGKTSAAVYLRAFDVDDPSADADEVITMRRPHMGRIIRRHTAQKPAISSEAVTKLNS